MPLSVLIHGIECSSTLELTLALFQTWFPAHYESYKDCLATLMASDPELKMPSSSSIFPAMTFNLGPHSVCWPHRDQLNLIWGICLDWILGHFDPSKGGHLILHEAMQILELGPGRIVLFPSAGMTHENTPVAPGETRYSVTGYAAGGFWRWIAQGFMTQTEWIHQYPEEAAQHEAENEKRWIDGCNLFKTIDELLLIWASKVNIISPCPAA